MSAIQIGKEVIMREKSAKILILIFKDIFFKLKQKNSRQSVKNTCT